MDINPDDLTEKAELPTKDYAIKLDYDLNGLWDGLIIPGRPKTDADYPVDDEGYAIGSKQQQDPTKMQPLTRCFVSSRWIL